MQFDIKKAQYIFFLTAAAVGAVYLLSHFGGLLGTILLPFIIARICAQFLSPPAEYLKNVFHVPKWVSCIFIVVTFYAALITFAYLLISRLFRELSGLSEYLTVIVDGFPGYIEKIREFTAEKLPFIPLFPNGGGTIGHSFEGLLSSFAEFLTGYLTKTIPALISFVPGTFVFAAVTILATCYFAADMKKINRFFLFQLPEKAKIFFSECRIQFFSTTSKYLGAYMTIAVITFAELFAGLLLIKREYAFVLALCITVIDILPFFGSGFVLIPWAVIESALGNRMMTVKIMLLYLVITVVRQIIEPRILGSFIGLHPLLTLFSIYAGGKLMGLAGVFIFPVIAMILKNLNDKKVLTIYKTPPDDSGEMLDSVRMKYKRFRRHRGDKL